MKDTKSDLANLMVNLEEKRVLELIREMVKKGVNPDAIVKELQNAMIEIGSRFEKEEYFVPDLIFAGEILKQSLGILKPHMRGESLSRDNKVVLGTVLGDVHDLGKDIVATLLNGNGYRVIDLGVDVPPESFVSAIKESGAKLLGLSALLTMSFDAIASTVKAVEEADLREHVSIMIGGEPVSEIVREKTNADFYGKDALDGLKFANIVYGRSS